MNRLLLSASCVAAVLSLFAATAQAQNPAGNGTGAGTAGDSTVGPTAAATAAPRHRGGGPEEHARQIISKYDKDGDRALNAAELTTFFEVIHQRVAARPGQPASDSTPSPAAKGKDAQPTHASPQEHAARAIEKFDKNGDGELDAGEIAALLAAIRDRATEKGGPKQPPAPGQKQATPAATKPGT